MKKRETRERHENAYHGLGLRKNAPNETRQIQLELESDSDSERVCFRDHSQKTNVYTRQFVPEIISSQGVLFQGRQ